MARVCARNEWINVGSPDRHVTTSINWLVAIAQYSWDSSQIAHSAAVISCFEFRWNFRKKWSSLVWSGSSFCKAKWRLYQGNKNEINKNQFSDHLERTFRPKEPTVQTNQQTLLSLGDLDVFDTTLHLSLHTVAHDYWKCLWMTTYFHRKIIVAIPARIY